MKRIMALFISLPFAGLILFPSSGYDRMQPFLWLKGSWKSATSRSTITESWSPKNDSTFYGESTITRSNGESKLRETIELVWREGSYYYIPVAIGQNNDHPVPFRITSFGDTGFVAENAEHDFPKRIIYTKVHNDSLHAVVDDGEDNSEKRFTFYFSRVKN